VTSKLNNGNHGREAAKRAFAETVETLDIGYVDLFLIHWPRPKDGRYVETWQALTELLGDGTLRSAGVSNFQIRHLEDLAKASDVVPAINQIELHPYLTQQALRDYHREHGIVTEAWSPLARGGDILRDPVVTTLAEKYGKTPAQVVLAWHVALGLVIFPKSNNRSRIEENFDIFDVRLSDEDVQAIGALNRDERIGPDPDDFG
jgi:diketogulonate reductase-like aldo/keto reductase